MDQVTNAANALFDMERLRQWLSSFLPGLIAAAATLVAFHVGWRVARRLATEVMQRSDTDATAQSFVQTVLKAVLMTMGVVSALSQVGIDTASILASLGVAGLTIGFAAKDTLSNVISGIFIFWDRPFVLGDLVEIEGQYGRVDRITMRSTRVVTADGKMLAIPNSVIVNTTVTSYTNFPHLRLDIPLTVGLGESYDKVFDIMLDVARAHPQFLSEPSPQVVVKSVGDYNVEVELQVWIDDETKHVVTRHELRRALYEALREASIDMPLQTLQLAPVEVVPRAAETSAAPHSPGS